MWAVGLPTGNVKLISGKFSFAWGNFFGKMTSRLKPRRVTNEDRYPWLLTRFHPRVWHYWDKPRRALAFPTLSPRPARQRVLMFLPMMMATAAPCWLISTMRTARPTTGSPLFIVELVCPPPARQLSKRRGRQTASPHRKRLGYVRVQLKTQPCQA